ncbi:MAG: hypothetical protein HY293_22860, partial [Planctomycetes bacterium]|nr:hypothetical protein [Planctomycetota bacterium]
MNFSLRPPGGDRTWNAALVFLGGAYMIYGGARKPIVPLLVVGSLLLISGAGLWCRQSWARWSAAACLVSLAAFMGWRLATGHFGWITLLSVLVMAWFAWRIVVEGKEEKPDENDKPLTSFVLLLDGPSRLS